MTAWLGILAVCLAVFMPGVNALKNRYLSSADDIFLVDICYGAQAAQDTPLAINGAGARHEHAARLVSRQVKVSDLVPAAEHSSHDSAPAPVVAHVDPDSQPSSGHHADHAGQCLYCGFFTHNLPLLHTASLPAMSYGFVSRIAPQHQHVSYYARPAFVPRSRAPPVFS